MGSEKGPDLLFVSAVAGDPSTWTCQWILADTQHTCNTASCYCVQWYSVTSRTCFLEVAGHTQYDKTLCTMRPPSDFHSFGRPSEMHRSLLNLRFSKRYCCRHQSARMWHPVIGCGIPDVSKEDGTSPPRSNTQKIVLHYEDEGTSLLWNIRNYMVSHPRRLSSSSQSWYLKVVLSCNNLDSSLLGWHCFFGSVALDVLKDCSALNCKGPALHTTVTTQKFACNDLCCASGLPDVWHLYKVQVGDAVMNYEVTKSEGELLGQVPCIGRRKPTHFVLALMWHR